MDDSKKTRSTKLVMDTVTELHRLGQVATRENVAQMTGLSLVVVDDRLKTLTNDGQLRRLLRGIYSLPLDFPPSRPVSVTETDDGWILAEVGDQVALVLSPREARMLGRGLAGHVDDFRAGESINRHLTMSTELTASVEQLMREVKQLKQAQALGQS